MNANISFTHYILVLLGGILAIILLTARWRVNAFYALTIAALLVGLGLKMPFLEILEHMKTGVGHMMRSLVFIIVLGTTLGLILEKANATGAIASFLLRIIGTKHAALALNITGAVVGLPIFCDSGYIVLSGIPKALSGKVKASLPVLATSLATGLYAVHCLVPPHPGISAAAANYEIDFGKLILYGILIAFPTALSGFFWASRIHGKSTAANEKNVEALAFGGKLPPLWKAVLPIIIPILFIGLKAMVQESMFDPILKVLGDPGVALGIGILLALGLFRRDLGENANNILDESVIKAGSILLIIGAGGAFGAVLAASEPEKFLGALPGLEAMGLFFPFLVAAVLKIAQGSSTVAIITASNLVLPLLSVLGLDDADGRLLTVLTMGAGSMMVSHTNDSYFWVIARFTNLDSSTTLRTFTAATFVMGLVAFLLIYLLAVIL